ncbi:Synaptotagmin-2 [Chlorella vulgaris]
MICSAYPAAEAQSGGNQAAGGGAPAAAVVRAVLQELGHCSSPAVPQSWRPGGFLLGCLFTGLVAAFIYVRYQFSIRRFSRRHQQREAVQQLSQMDAQELRQVLGELNLPSWVQYPDFERVQWLDSIMKQLWPFAAQYVTSLAQETLPALLDESKPSWIRDVKLHRFDLGPVHPEPLSVKVYDEAESRTDEIIIEFDFVWAGQQEISFIVKPVPRAAAHAVTRLPVAQQLVDVLSNLVVIKAACERVTLNGRLRLTLRPLSRQLPLFGAVQVSFTEMPRFSFDMSALGGDVSILPGLENWMHGLVRDSLLQPFVLPEKYVIPFQEANSPEFERPRALLQVQVVEAKHVPRMDLLSRSDPYLELFVRSKNKVKTQCIQHSSNPQWQETFNLLVHYPESQRLVAVLFDYDVFDRDDEIGRVEVPLRDLPRGQEVDEWYDVVPPHQEKPAAPRPHQGLLASTAHAGQKAMTLHEIPESTPEDSAHATPRNPAAPDLGRLSSSVRTALEGGVLCLRIVRIETLVGKSWLLGGWKSRVKAHVSFAGQEKQTLSVKASGGQAAVDQELEFVLDGHNASQRGRVLGVTVVDTHWRNVAQGRVSVEFDKIRDARLWRATLDLQEVKQGRITLEAQWTPLLATAEVT